MLRLKTWEWFLVLLRSVAVLYSLVIVAVWIHLARTEPNPTFTNLIYGVPFTAVGLFPTICSSQNDDPDPGG